MYKNAGLIKRKSTVSKMFVKTEDGGSAFCAIKHSVRVDWVVPQTD